jgi:hypothetical protein
MQLHYYTTVYSEQKRVVKRMKGVQRAKKVTRRAVRTVTTKEIFQTPGLKFQVCMCSFKNKNNVA